jgi:hypothetical protein
VKTSVLILLSTMLSIIAFSSRAMPSGSPEPSFYRPVVDPATYILEITSGVLVTRTVQGYRGLEWTR